MNSTNGASETLSAESLPLFTDGISLIFSRWTALQRAVQDEWGGRDSRQKSQNLADDVLSWFTKSKGPLYIDDLENMLDESMLLLFNAELEDGSIEEVAEKMMIMYEECLQGNYELIENLRKSDTNQLAVSQSKQVINEEDDESSDNEYASDMVVDEPKPKVESKHIESVEAEDGWSVVPSRRNRSKRSG